MPDQQLPASLTGTPPMGAASVSTPSGNPGAKAMALSKIRQAADMINSVISSLDVGSPEHKEILKIVEKLGNIAPLSATVPGVQQTTLRGMQRDADQSAMMQSIMRQQGGGQGGAPGGGAMQQPDPTAGMAG